MLNLFQSNQMQALATLFCERNNEQGDPFEPVTVVVQSFGLGQWLKLQHAERHGIAGNIDCILPANFLWQLYQRLIPGAEKLSDSPFDADRLRWRIMKVINANPGLSGSVQRYLDAPGDRDLRLFQLASELALLFDGYLMYRPDWISDWSNPEHVNSADMVRHEGWQSELWRLLLDDLGDYRDLHRGALHERTLAALDSTGVQDWQRLSVFGLSSMPPLQLDTFEALSRDPDREVDIYFLNPCEHYWGDIVSPRDKARRSIRSLIDAPADSLTDEDYLEVGNPILASLGKQGREYFELLVEASAAESWEYFVPPDPSTRLGYVKQDILNLTHGGAFDGNPELTELVDQSIQVHACHSRMREVEVLHDEILRAMDTTPGLTPKDIIVMVPDIESYAPFVQAVFSQELSTGTALPYRISDRGALNHSTLLESFLHLLNLPDSRITGPEVMDLLEVPAAMRHLELDQDDLETAAWWIEQAGIRWETTAQQKADNWQVPAEHQNTWRFGLDRLLLGFAMSPAQSGEHSTDQPGWQGVLPIEISPQDTALLGKLCDFVDLLDSYRSQLREDRTVAEWQALISQLTSAFYAPRGDELLEINQIMAVTDTLSADTLATGYDQPVSRQLIRHAFTEALSAFEPSAGLISGGITFATLVPMRSIPFRMVCLLGMNSSDYPREQRPHSFDLMAARPSRRGDRSRKLDDRYLFLEAILSAQDILYISYEGRGARDDKEKPPSVVVTEWLNYLDDLFGEAPVLEHHLQPFNSRYYQGDERQSYATLWHDALSAPSASTIEPGLLASEEEHQCESIDQLCRFLAHPARTFMEQRLSVYLRDEDVDLDDTEPFELDNLERFRLADEMLDCLVKGQSLEHYRARLLMTGDVMSGPMGKGQLEREAIRARDIYALVQQELTSPPTPVNSTIDLDGGSLEFSSDQVYGGNTQVNYRVGTLGARYLLTCWVNHLALCTSGEGIQSVFVHRHRNRNTADATRLMPVNPAEARRHLDALLSLYNEGTTAPLLLPPAAAREFTESRLKSGSESDALARVRRHWESVQPGSEGMDRYWIRLFDLPGDFSGPSSPFTRLAPLVWQPLLEHIDRA